MELPPVMLLVGTYTMEVTSWNLHNGSYLMERTPLKLPHGSYTMEVTSRNIQLNGNHPTLQKIITV